MDGIGEGNGRAVPARRAGDDEKTGSEPLYGRAAMWYRRAMRMGG
jgi:hypothetical protein